MRKNVVHKNPNKYLQFVDPVLTKLIPQIKLQKRKAHNRYFEALTSSIISQQLSTKAADTIEARFMALFGSKKFPKPEQVLKKSTANLRKAGLSFQKINYIKGLAKAVEQRSINFKKFKNLTDEEIIEVLTQIKGIGRWTAEMFLMFCMDRPDVFSHGDLGLKNALKKWYKLDMKRHHKKYQRIVEAWKPHRTLAARYLWASLSLK